MYRGLHSVILSSKTVLPSCDSTHGRRGYGLLGRRSRRGGLRWLIGAFSTAGLGSLRGVEAGCVKLKTQGHGVAEKRDPKMEPGDRGEERNYLHEEGW